MEGSVTTSGYRPLTSTNLEHPGPGLGAVLQEAGALFARGLLQPALIVHLRQAVGAPDLSARRLVVRPDAVQGHLSSPASNRRGRSQLHRHITQEVNRPHEPSSPPPVKPLPLQRLVLVIRVHNDLFTPEVHNLVEVQRRHVDLAREEDGAVACEGQSERRD